MSSMKHLVTWTLARGGALRMRHVRERSPTSALGMPFLKPFSADVVPRYALVPALQEPGRGILTAPARTLESSEGGIELPALLEESRVRVLSTRGDSLSQANMSVLGFFSFPYALIEEVAPQSAAAHFVVFEGLRRPVSGSFARSARTCFAGGQVMPAPILWSILSRGLPPVGPSDASATAHPTHLAEHVWNSAVAVSSHCFNVLHGVRFCEVFRACCAPTTICGRRARHTWCKRYVQVCL